MESSLHQHTLRCLHRVLNGRCVQASVTVTPLSLRDWLLRPVPTPMDPSLTLYGAAVHNAHVACCEVVIGGLLSAIEEGEMERPPGLPSGTLLSSLLLTSMSFSSLDKASSALYHRTQRILL